jgi:prepilin peptidase CpaA
MITADAAALAPFANVVLTVLLAAASVSDLRSRRIPNGVVAALALGGIAFALAAMPWRVGLERALGGTAVGLLLWLPFWLAGVLGAGDVKLAGAAGAWLGVAGVVEASLVGAAVGGVLALWTLVRHGGLRMAAVRFGIWLVAARTTRSLVPELTPREHRLPYGLAIAAGAALVAWVPGLIW